VKKNIKLTKDEIDENEDDNLGTFAIEDFDVAIKNFNPLKQFRKYIIEFPNHY